MFHNIYVPASAIYAELFLIPHARDQLATLAVQDAHRRQLYCPPMFPSASVRLISLKPSRAFPSRRSRFVKTAYNGDRPDQAQRGYVWG
jgi:hypothetical protein